MVDFPKPDPDPESKYMLRLFRKIRAGTLTPEDLGDLADTPQGRFLLQSSARIAALLDSVDEDKCPGCPECDPYFDAESGESEESEECPGCPSCNPTYGLPSLPDAYLLGRMQVICEQLCDELECELYELPSVVRSLGCPDEPIPVSVPPRRDGNYLAYVPGFGWSSAKFAEGKFTDYPGAGERDVTHWLQEPTRPSA